jgi:hypothetical protein
MIVSLPLRSCPGVFMNISLREHHDLNKYFDVARLTIITPLSLLPSCSLPFPNVGLEIYSLYNFSFKSPI